MKNANSEVDRNELPRITSTIKVGSFVVIFAAAMGKTPFSINISEHPRAPAVYFLEDALRRQKIRSEGVQPAAQRAGISRGVGEKERNNKIKSSCTETDNEPNSI